MELSKLQIIALCVLTTIFTDKFLINHNYPIATSIPISSPTPIISQVQSLISTPSATNTQTEIILQELINIRKDIASVNSQSNKVATDSSSPAPTLTTSLLGGMVKISSPEWKRLDVYEKPLTSSKIINSLVYDTIYFYRQKQNDWYQLDLDGGQLGWVQSQFLKEFP
ncbi:MAG: SH3 domain-containing protein [Candidatus Shapirobacteria bacterium]|jgi:hypothetical protein